MASLVSVHKTGRWHGRETVGESGMLSHYVIDCRVFSRTINDTRIIARNRCVKSRNSYFHKHALDEEPILPTQHNVNILFRINTPDSDQHMSRI